MSETALSESTEFLFCIDSDGTIMDTMTRKHRECFIPATIACWGLEAISDSVRKCAEFVNLYSCHRGMNRFPALIITMQLISEQTVVQKEQVQLPDLTSLAYWCETTESLSTSALETFLSERASPDPVLLQVLRWSKRVDANVSRLTDTARAFDGAKAGLAVLKQLGKTVVVSTAPYRTLARDLTEGGVSNQISEILGQEAGTKTKSICERAQGYEKNHVLMIGDALGDWKAAEDNGVLFYPILPGREEESWKNLIEDVIPRILNGSYRGSYMNEVFAEFSGALPSKMR